MSKNLKDSPMELHLSIWLEEWCRDGKRESGRQHLSFTNRAFLGGQVKYRVPLNVPSVHPGHSSSWEQKNNMRATEQNLKPENVQDFHSCVVSPAPAQPKAPAAQEADQPSGWHHRVVDSPSPPPANPLPVPTVLWEALEAEVREGQQVMWAQAVLPSLTVQTGTEAHDSCCQWDQASGLGWRAKSETCCHWAMRQEVGLWKVWGTG